MFFPLGFRAKVRESHRKKNVDPGDRAGDSPGTREWKDRLELVRYSTVLGAKVENLPLERLGWLKGMWGGLHAGKCKDFFFFLNWVSMVSVITLQV